MKANFRTLLEKAANILGVLTFGLFVYAFAKDIWLTYRLSSIPPLLLNSLVIVFFLLRPAPKEANLSLSDWFVGLCGTFLPLLFRPDGSVSHDVTPLLVIQMLGIVFAVVGLLSLNRSFGVVAANRGVKTAGAYKYVRHPLYAGYLVSNAAYCMQNATLANLIILALWIFFEIARIFAEEDHLSKDPAYREYMRAVRWRLIPGVF